MRIILAGDGTKGAAGAVRLTSALAADTGASVEVVRVLEPGPTQGPGAVGTLSFGEGGGSDDRSKELREETATWLRDLSPDAARWPIQIAPGPVPLAIARAAQSFDASFILIGAGRHDRLERWLGTETSLRVTQLAHVPVVAVPSDGGERPRTVVAAVDFSDFASDAIRSAVAISHPDATFHLAHSLWYPREGAPTFGTEEWYAEHHRQSLEQLGEWAAGFEELKGRKVELHNLEGAAADEIVKLSERVGADLVAAGSHGRGYFGRVLLGSVSTALIRRAQCAVLVTPPRAPAREVRGSDATHPVPPAV